MTPGSGGSNARTRPSVTVVIRLIQRICAAVIGRVKPNRIATITVSASPPLVGRVQAITLRMLS